MKGLPPWILSFPPVNAGGMVAVWSPVLGTGRGPEGSGVTSVARGPVGDKTCSETNHITEEPGSVLVRGARRKERPMLMCVWGGSGRVR